MQGFYYANILEPRKGYNLGKVTRNYFQGKVTLNKWLFSLMEYDIIYGI